MKIPLIVYDIDSRIIPINPISKSNSFFLRSFQLFSITIIESTISNNAIYSVKENPNYTSQDDLFIIDKEKSFDAVNFAYTLFIENDCTILISTETESKLLNIKFVDIQEEQEIYSDLLINNNLPTFEILEPAIVSKNKAELIKRLLLDFKYLINKKGTKVGITKFLNLIGFDPLSIKVYEEFETPSGTLTTSPNKLEDIKTGNYHVLFDNYKVNPNDKWTNKNLPKRILNIEDLEEFFKSLWYALTIANTYFTLPEQDINFFGINYSANSERFLSIAGNTSITNYQDIHNFRKKIRIKLFNQLSFGENPDIVYLVNNKLQFNSDINKSSVRTYNDSPLSLVNEIELIDRELFNGEPIDSDIDITKIDTLFANIIHIHIHSPNTYLNYKIEGITSPLSVIKSDNKELLTSFDKKLILLTKVNGKYKITIDIFDLHNNRERYIYEYELSNKNSKISLIAYNSSVVNENIINKLTVDNESPWFVSAVTPNYILNQNDIPTELTDYYEKDITGLILQYLNNNKGFNLQKLNGNFSVDSATDTIPVDFLDNYLSIFTTPYQSNKTLKIRTFDDYSRLPILKDYTEEPLLFVTVLDISIDSVIEPYLFITTIEAGIDITKNIFDLVLIDENDNVESIFDIVGNLTKDIPVNFDFPLFFRESDLVPAFINHPIIDPAALYTELPTIKSIYPRLVNMAVDGNNQDVYSLKMGDVVMCIPDDKYISGNYNIKWTVTNGFTNAVIYESDDYMLKFRINEATIFNIKLEFLIDNILFTVFKKSLVSSFN